MVRQCFKLTGGEEREFVRLRKIVEETLKKPTTLVVLDGLDESSGCS